jgi:hypothetical protein
MFLNTPVKVFDAISNSTLTSINNELYENGIRIATQTDTDTLQTEIDELGVSVNTNTNSINSLGVIVNSQGATINSLGVAVNTNTATINSLGVAVNTNTATINSLGVAVNTNTANISTLQSSSLVTDTPLVTPSAGSIIFSDGINPLGTNTDSSFTYTNISKPILTVGAGRIVSNNNNMELESTDYILTKKDFYLQGTADVQRYLTVGCLNQNDNVKTYVDKTTADYICDNQLASKTQWKGASEYDFDTDLKIGTLGQSKKLYLNNIEIKPAIANLSNYYVSSSGSNASGNGSIINPWGTIGYAVSVLNALVGDITAVINVASGNYAETNIIVTKSGVSIIGANAISTIFTGDIYFNMAVSSAFYSVGQLANISVYGCIYHNNPHIYSNSFSISGIISAPPNAKSNVIMSSTGGGLGSDCTINNNSILYANSDTTPIILNQNSSLTGVGFQISNNPTLSFTLQNYIRVQDSARCNLFACSLINSSNSASVGALININNTSNVTSSTTINNCQLLFPSGVATTTGAIINFTNTASSNTVNYYGNFSRSFLTQNAPNNYLILKSGGGAVNFSQGSNIARQGGHNIPATGAFTGWTKTNFQAVI